ncbi:MAG: protein kinase, partial [Planctomycetes bacterium]|nr:protein kinase [Planctomycetota bacterium]
MKPADDSAGLPDELAERVFALLGESEHDAEVGLSELCAAHPEHAAAIRAALRVVDAELATTAPGRPTVAESTLPQRIGPFRIRGLLGRGGMGTVYLAEQLEVDARPVALKVVRTGLAWGSLLERFELERAALLRLDHPGIARLWTSGATEDGAPFFAMEYVRGAPIDAWCVAQRLDTRARLQLFVDVCAAVQHAHDHALVHRDLKPSNILVEDGRPRVIDFGIARSLAADDPAELRAQRTEPGDVLGTPGYMSPEQLDGRDSVDVRSDVWALGVVLYQLLTGRLPFPPPRDTAPRVALEAIREAVSQRAAAAPSTVVSARTSAPPGALVPASELRGDIDAVVLKALQRAPEMRYQSAAEFADDLLAILAHRPVTAWRVTPGYRLRCLVRRRAGAVAVAAVIGGIAVVGLVGSAIGKVEADAARAVELRLQGRAEQSAAAARRHRKRFDLLAWRVELDRARQLAASLHPARPQVAPQMRAWLHDYGEPLRAAEPLLAQALRELASGAVPGAAADVDSALQAELRERERRLQVLATVNDASAPTSMQVGLEIEQAEHRRHITALRTQLAERRSVRLPNDADQLLFDTLTAVQRELETFVHKELPAVRDRLAWAETVVARTITDHADRWRHTCAAVAADPRFRGVRLTPQVGLVPLGPDPASRLQEFALLRSGTLPRRHAVHGRLLLDDDSAAVFVLLPPGQFTMGAQRDDPSAPCHDPYAIREEGPPGPVRLEAFFLGKHELTQAQWMRLAAGDNPSQFHPGRRVGGQVITARHPVENVSWTMADALLRQHALELPTEAQWEYACRA